MNVSLGDRPSAYIVAHRSATALPASESKVGSPSSMICWPPLSAENIGVKSNQDWKNSLVGAGQIAASAAPLSTILRLVARNSSCVDSGGFSGSMPAFFRMSLL